MNLTKKEEFRLAILDQERKHIRYVGNEILEEEMTAKDFWEKLKVLCLQLF